MPTKQTAPFGTSRAAAMVIISSAVYVASDMGLRLIEALQEPGKIGGAEDVALDPAGERLSLARNRIPRLVERVVARVIAERVRRKGAAWHLADRADDP